MAIVQSEGNLQRSLSPVNPVGYNTSRIMGGVTWYSGLTEDYASIYRTQPNVRLVVNFFARNIAQIGLKAYERISDTERQALTGHPLSDLLRMPNEVFKLTRHRYILSLVSDLKIFDNHFALKVRNPVTGRIRLFRLPPQYVVPADDSPWFYATAWKFLGVSSQPIFSADDVLHIRGFNPEDPRVGLSPIETIRQILREDQAASEYREQFWKQGARISGIIERPPQGQAPRWSEPAKQRFLAEWQATYANSGPGAGGTPILEDGMTYKEVSFSAKDSEYLGARRLSREEVAAVFHLSPIFVGILENANFSNVQEQHKNLYQDAFGPDLNMIEEDLEAQLVPEYEDLASRNVYLEFNLQEKLKGSFEEEATTLQTAVGRPWMTADEARARQNLPPVEGGDQLVTPLNVLVGGQASPRDSAPPPGSASRASLAKDGLTLVGEKGPELIALPDGAKVKSVADLADDVRGWFEKHVEIMTSHFGRQETALINNLQRGDSLDVAWQGDRWDTELGHDLTALAVEMTGEIASKVASDFGGSFDSEIAQAFLATVSTSAANSINYTTKNELDALEDDESFLDKVRNVFLVAASARAAQIAVSRVTGIGNFARKEGGYQAGATKKRWVVRSANSRHPEMNGQTVGIEETFSNGARWPGDQENLSVDSTADCTCELEIVQ